MRFSALIVAAALALAACHDTAPPASTPAPDPTPRATGGPCHDGTVLHGTEQCP